MLRIGARGCLATSSGNTGSALAASCARNGLSCTILVNESAPAGKLAQMRAHAARVIRLPGFVTLPAVTEAAFATLEELSDRFSIPLIVSAYKYCPEGMARVEVIGAEILSAVEALHIFVPVGGGGLCSAVLKGTESTEARVHAVQPAGCDTVVTAFHEGSPSPYSVESKTRISGLSVPMDIDGTLLLELLRRRGSLALTVTDEEVFEAQQMMFELEGIYGEPASAAALAGARKAVNERSIDGRDPVVCLVTGHGFKDPDSVDRAAALHPEARVNPESLREYLIEEVCRS
jgi:threonine synthase